MKAARTFSWWLDVIRINVANTHRFNRFQDADRLWRVHNRAVCRRRYVADWRDIGKPWPFRRVTQ